MSNRTLLLLTICLLRNVSFAFGFKVPGENRADIPPRIRPDLLQKAEERGYSVGGVNPLASRSKARRHRKREEVPYMCNAKGKDAAKYSDPKYWNEVEWKYQQKRGAIDSKRRDKSMGIVWKTIAIALAVICSPVLLPLLVIILLTSSPWAIAGFALYKSVELFVEGNKPTCTPPFEKDENGDEMDNITYMYEAHATDGDEIDESGHMAFQQ